MQSISAEGAIHWRVESHFQPRKLSGLPQANVKRAVGAKRIQFGYHFTEWSREGASDIDGQLVRARERKRASQTPYNSDSAS